MAAVPQIQAITEEDLLRLNAKDERYEVINGELVPMTPVGLEHSVIAGNVYDVLKPHTRQHKLGYVHGDSLIYVLPKDGGNLHARVPDVSFIRKGRLPEESQRHRPFRGAPDLAVEIVSPGEIADDLRDKIKDYLSEGTEQVWVLYPKQREIHVYQGLDPEQVTIYKENDTLTAESLFPGLEIKVADCFVADDFEE